MIQQPTLSPLRELGHLVEVEANKRRLILASVSLFGFVLLSVYGVAHFSIDESRLGSFYVLCAAFCAANLVYLYKRTSYSIPLTVLNTTLGGICVVLLYRGMTEGFEPYWLFPVLCISLLINRFAHALTSAVLLVALTLAAQVMGGLSLLDTPFAENSGLRLLLSLSGMACIVLVAVYRTERASKLLLELHEEDIHRLAYYDSLTGLANRPSYLRWLSKVLERARKDARSLAVLYIDLDNFKQINDRCGHRQGDRVLVEFGNRLANCVRPQDGTTRLYADEDVARLAGDEFVVTLHNLREPADAAQVAQRILELFENGFSVDGITHPISASIGITFSESDNLDAETLLNQADSAMYHAKQTGKNTMSFFSKSIAEAVSERRNIEQALQVALAENLLQLQYMPIFASNSLEIVAVEALIRSTHPLLMKTGPGRFIPIAEASGQIRSIDEWVMHHAIGMQRRLRDDAAFTGKMSINVSAVELHNPELPVTLAASLAEHAVSPGDIEIEITETALITGDELSLRTLHQIRDTGVSICLDDFGTGYTAFNQLMNYPVSTLKIDRSFVQQIFTGDKTHRKMAGMLKKLAELYELQVIAEGVETAQQLKYLKRIGCDSVQGYFLARPMTAEALVAHLQEAPRGH